MKEIYRNLFFSLASTVLNGWDVVRRRCRTARLQRSQMRRNIKHTDVKARASFCTLNTNEQQLQFDDIPAVVHTENLSQNQRIVMVQSECTNYQGSYRN